MSVRAYPGILTGDAGVARSVLMFAACQVVEYLLKQGADVNVVNLSNQTPLHFSAGGNSMLAVVPWLVCTRSPCLLLHTQEGILSVRGSC